MKKNDSSENKSTDKADADSLEDGGDELYREIFGLLFEQTRTDFSKYKFSTVSRRILRQVQSQKFKNLKEYVAYLRKDPDSVKKLSNEMFIHVTEFFRDPVSFVALKEQVFPKLFEKQISGVPLRIWVPGCSTGEEVYSIAIALIESAPQEQIKFQIFATDVSDEAVQIARLGFYAEKEVSGLTRPQLERYFDRVKDGYKIKKEIRDSCIFSKHDLSTNPPFAKINLISCRNVLIYFSPELQKEVLPVFHYALSEGGFLWLGRSEAPLGISKLFSTIDKNNKIYCKINAAAAANFRFPAHHHVSKMSPVQKPEARSVQAFDQQREIDRIILMKYAPAGVVVNSDFEIIQVRGHTSPYLELPSGQPNYGLLKMLRPELLPEIRLALQIVKKNATAVRKEGLSYRVGNTQKKVDVDIIPIEDQLKAQGPHFLILFQDSKIISASDTARIKVETNKKQKKENTTADNKTAYIAELLRELDTMREYQQTLAEGYEAAREELTSSNEELQSALEEYQSTNEELETAKEELQAANEELTTLNVELQSRNDELAISEERFRLLADVVRDYAIFMIDTEGNVVTWNEGARRLKGYEAEEIIGKHFSKFYTAADLEAGKPERELEIARLEGRYEEEGIRIRKDGSKFMANVVLTAIRDDAGRLRGYSKVTRDISERKKAELALMASEERYRLMIEAVRDYAIFMLDPQGRVSTWNEGAKRIKGYSANEIVGKHFSQFYSEEDRKAHKPQLKLEQAAQVGRVEDEGWRIKKDGSRFWAHVLITRVTDEKGNVIGFSKVTRDLTERKEADEKLKRAHESLEEKVKERTLELERALKVRDEFVSVASHELKTPLTALRLQAQIAKRYVKKGEFSYFTEDRLTQFTNQLDTQVDRLVALVEDMLDVSRIQLGKVVSRFERVNLSEVIRSVVDRFSLQFNAAGCEVHVTLEDSIEGTWDRNRIEQVLLNLFSNATKYGSGKPIVVKAFKSGEKAIIEVTDQGVGVSRENQGRIFERFERAISANEVSGLGLGLYISREIVRAHEGEIRVESELGKGAKFIVELPLKPSRQAVTWVSP